MIKKARERRKAILNSGIKGECVAGAKVRNLGVDGVLSAVRSRNYL